MPNNLNKTFKPSPLVTYCKGAKCFKKTYKLRATSVLSKKGLFLHPQMALGSVIHPCITI